MRRGIAAQARLRPWQWAALGELGDGEWKRGSDLRTRVLTPLVRMGYVERRLGVETVQWDPSHLVQKTTMLYRITEKGRVLLGTSQRPQDVDQ